jgi:Flp pilus assembly protein TadG
MCAAANMVRRFVKSTRGVAAIEFAAILPVLAVIFLGSFDGGRAIAIYLKVRSATFELAAITNQYGNGAGAPPIQSSDMTAITGATSLVMSPYTSTTPVVTISQIAISNKGKATIAWSYSKGGTARTQGASITIPAGLIVNSSYLIFAEVSYNFTPMFGFFGSAITFSDNLYVTPRSSTCVVYVPQQTATQCT